MVQNMERLDETVKEEADGVHNTLGTCVCVCRTRVSHRGGCRSLVPTIVGGHMIIGLV